MKYEAKPQGWRWVLTVELSSSPDHRWIDMFLDSSAAREQRRPKLHPTFQQRRISIEFPAGALTEAVRFVEEATAFANRIYGSTRVGEKGDRQ